MPQDFQKSLKNCLHDSVNIKAFWFYQKSCLDEIIIHRNIYIYIYIYIFSVYIKKICLMSDTVSSTVNIGLDKKSPLQEIHLCHTDFKTIIRVQS